MRGASGAGVATPDAQFNYVTMLLHGDGTNGAQNNTFVDSSTNAFTITRNGTPTQGSFSPYGTLWSNYFDGSSALQTPNNSNLYLGSSNFTIECWVNLSYNSGGPNIIRTVNSYSFALIQGTTTLLLYLSSNGSSWDITGGSNIGSFTPNTWNHVAIVRNGSTFTCYLNGVAGATVTSASALYQTNGFYIGKETGGGYLNGYVSNARIVIGTVVYTSAFTPSTTPLTAITNTQLLTCQSNRFIDNSTNAYAITPTGTPSVQRFNPFLPTSSQAYSTSVYGGSGYLNGSSDYLTASSNSAFAFGVGAFTIEFWIYPTDNFHYFASPFTTGSSTTDFVLDVQTTGLTLDVNNNAVILATSSIPLTLNSWNHVAVSRGASGTTLYIFINGQIGASVTNSTSWTNSGNVTIGKQAGYYVPGYITDLRVVKGTQVYSSAFTPPTSQLTAITNTSLLLSMQNAGIYDNAMGIDYITGGSAQISTSVKKYGTGSLSFNGSTSYLQSQIGQNFIFYTGNWTIECWFYITSSVNYQTIYAVSDNQSTGTNEISARFDGSNNMLFYVYANGSYVVNGGAGTSSALSLNTWYHHALVRNGTNISCYLNGVNTSSTTISSSITINGQTMNCIVGCNVPSTLRFFNGYIDDFRITKGYARYTSNFTPPTAAFSNTGPV